ncbi:hypothetical protein P7M11_09660 [Bisgaard Taxon 10/6]|uniref:hypothetical protein n=1 Tax=Exercitatus varius TaxID=67857 RepID=UPI00294AB507|nr:hypothetical protein [Exercitatus varius]MDG2954976.1 hypothetical protein [Exercitatus varius]
MAKLKNYLDSQNALNDSYDMKQAQSLKQGLEVASVMGVNYGLAQSVWSILPKVGQVIDWEYSFQEISNPFVYYAN